MHEDRLEAYCVVAARGRGKACGDIAGLRQERSLLVVPRSTAHVDISVKINK